jgi:hypothetical protein
MPETPTKPTPLQVWMTTLIDNPLFGEDWKNRYMPVENQTIERWVRYAYLLYCNHGNMQVNGYGVTNHGNYPYKLGLEQNEAFELMQMSAIINAATWYDDSFSRIYSPLINERVAYWLEYYKTTKQKQENPQI